MAVFSPTKSKSTSAADATLAKALAPEDIRPGDYVTPLFVIAEVPSFWWCADAWRLAPNEPVRIRFTPTEGVVLKVRSVCLPFVLVKNPANEQSTLDLRKCQLARLDKSHARCAWKAFKKTARRNKRQQPALTTSEKS